MEAKDLALLCLEDFLLKFKGQTKRLNSLMRSGSTTPQQIEFKLTIYITELNVFILTFCRVRLVPVGLQTWFNRTTQNPQVRCDRVWFRFTAYSFNVPKVSARGQKHFSNAAFLSSLDPLKSFHFSFSEPPLNASSQLSQVWLTPEHF